MKRDTEDRELPRGTLRGRFYILETVVDALERVLPTYRGPDGNHEGIAFLFGRALSADATIFLTAIAPNADHRRGYVRCSEQQVAEATAAMRQLGIGLGLLAQVHTHPGEYTMHSPGDDTMVFMPFEGMLSIVAPYYAHFGLRPIDSLGVHQFQDGRWVLAEREGVRHNFLVVPNSVDVR
jgi:hypothetical protein